MGLLDSILGAVNGQAQNAGGGGGIASIVSMVSNNPQILEAVTHMLGNDGAHGGLGGLMAKFEQAGMGDVIQSWVGTGQNQAISGDQLSNVLGSDALSGMAAKMGVNPGDLAGQLSSVLPGLIDHLTPHGQAPSAGVGNSADLMGALSGLLRG